MKILYIFFHISLCAYLIISCGDGSKNIRAQRLSKNIIEEYDIIRISLAGKLADRSSEISGLCWFNDHLILLPQYPERFGDNIGKIFFIRKKIIENYLTGKSTTPILPEYYKINLSNLRKYFRNGSGFESITTDDTIAYFTLEHISNVKTETLLMFGKIDPVKFEIIIDEKSIQTEPSENQFYNLSSESIIAFNDQIIPIYEVHGGNIIKSPTVSVFDSELNFLRKIDFPQIEYRITDVTSVDDSGRFWAINYLYPGDFEKLNPSADIISDLYGIGSSHLEFDPIERIIQFQVSGNEIILSNHRPFYLKLEDNKGRNWEGIAKMDSLGFLIVTDKYPETILAFLKTP